MLHAQRGLVAMTTLLAWLPTSVIAAERPELEPIRLLLADGEAELSGIAIHKGRTYIVSDGPEQHFLYDATPAGGWAALFGGKSTKAGKNTPASRFPVNPAIDLSRFSGWQGVRDGWQTATQVAEKHRRLDLEGLTACGDVLYAANERVRQILVIDLAAKSIATAPIDFSSYPDLFAGEANAGFEGLAADCAHRVLYIAKEREPRRILKVGLDDWKLTGHFDIPSSDRAGQRVINIFTGHGLMDVGPDFADMFYEPASSAAKSGFLYLLERNTYEVAKVDLDAPGGPAVVARVSYLMTEKPLYETGEPFGVAEALLLTPTEIWVGFDNNGTPLSARATKETGISGTFPGFYVYKRPPGF